MEPNIPFKATDFATDYSPKLTSLVAPSNINVDPIPFDGDDSNLVYWGLGFVFVVFIISTGYSIYQNFQILKGLEEMKEAREGIMPAITFNS